MRPPRHCQGLVWSSRGFGRTLVAVVCHLCVDGLPRACGFREPAAHRTEAACVMVQLAANTLVKGMVIALGLRGSRRPVRLGGALLMLELTLRTQP